MKKYSSYTEFQQQNDVHLQQVVNAKTKLKSVSDLAMTGQALTESESLAFEFLNLSQICTDLMFGLSSSVLDAKAEYKRVEGIFFRENTKSAADKAKLVQADDQYVKANQTFNDLTDLLEYLQGKKKDFETAHYYYRAMNSNK
jgi:hypothetical protein